MNTAVTISFVFLSVGALLALVRLVRGPSLADRVVAADLLLVLLSLAIAVDAARTRDGTYLSVMLIVAVLGFLGTTTVARFIERRGA
jgi:multicomponent Na+:H+ antiporter subunit F